jgi:hypothetical protein
LSRRIFLFGAMLALPLVGASNAGAAQTFTDPAGDAAGGGADITQVDVSNDATGKITLAFTIPNRTTFSSTDTLAIVFDTDRNASTGSSGVDYGIVVTASGARVVHWNGTTFVPSAQTTLTTANNGMTISVNRSELGNTTGFNFLAETLVGSTASDVAPDTSSWSYDLGLKPVLNTLAASFSPAKPRAGHVFRLAQTQLRLEDGTVVKADSITCIATLNGKRLAGRCAWHIPRNARGRRLVVVLTAHYQGATATFTPWRFRVVK